MAEVADEAGVGFVDLFTSDAGTVRIHRRAADAQRRPPQRRRLSRPLAPILDRALFGEQGVTEPAIDAERIRAEIADKNFHWWHRYRAVNGYSIYGTRGEAGSDGTYRNRDVMERERAILDQMTANRDRRIWALARGEASPRRGGRRQHATVHQPEDQRRRRR